MPFIGRYYSNILTRISFVYSWIFYKKNAQFFDWIYFQSTYHPVSICCSIVVVSIFCSIPTSSINEHLCCFHPEIYEETCLSMLHMSLDFQETFYVIVSFFVRSNVKSLDIKYVWVTEVFIIPHSPSSEWES